MNSLDRSELFRRLPAIDQLQQTAAALSLKERWRADLVDDEIRSVVDDTRRAIQNGDDPGSMEAESFVARAAERLDARFPQGVTACINATGVVLHTGLGRAVLPQAAVDALTRELTGYSIVSIDREEGARIRRETAIAGILSVLTGAEHATIVNNNAAATVITLNTMAAGREVVISRGQLVEIGGSFRMPDVFRTAGVTLREVGATNRTNAADYERAIGEDTGLLIRVHPSNYKVIGFTGEVGIEELVGIASRHGLPVLDDLGAGALRPMPPEPEIAESVRAGADLITCSGDKLFIPSNGLTAISASTDGAEPKKLWNESAQRPGTASPLVIGDKVYIINNAGVLNCADRKSGERLWRIRLKGPLSSSPVAGSGERIYAFNEAGIGQVVDLSGEEGAITSEFELGETILSTPSLSENGIYVRSDGHLWKFAAD